MQVETGAATSGAPRGVSRLGIVPLLAVPQSNQSETARSLWTTADRKRDDKREQLRDDESRVQGVVDGMGQTVAERVQEVRSKRADARAGAEKKMFAKDLANERAMLRDASGGTTGGRTTKGDGKPASTTGDSSQPAVQSKSAATADSTSDIVSSALDSQSSATAPKLQASGKETPQTSSGALSPEKSPPQAQATFPTPQNSQQKPSAFAVATTAMAAQSPIANELGNAGTQSSSTIAATSNSQPKGAIAAVASTETTPRSTGSRTGQTTAQSSAPKDNAEGTDNDHRAENVQRMLRVLRGSLMRDKSSTVIRLDPPELGSLRLEMNLRKDAMDLRVGAGTDAAREMLRDELESLRNGLQAAGIRLERVEVYSLAAPPMLEQEGSRTQERQAGGEPRDAAPKRSMARDAAHHAATRVEAGDQGWTPDRPNPVALAPGRVNVIV